MKVEFFKGLTDISKRRNLDRKICNNLKLLCLKIQKNQKYPLLQKLQTLNSVHFTLDGAWLITIGHALA